MVADNKNVITVGAIAYVVAVILVAMSLNTDIKLGFLYFVAWVYAIGVPGLILFGLWRRNGPGTR